MNKYIILSIVCFLLMILAVAITENNKQIDQGDCFDERDNRINELTCDVPVYDYPYLWLLAASLLLSAVVLFFKGLIDS